MVVVIVCAFVLLLIASLLLIIFSTVAVTVTMEHSSFVEELRVDVKALFGLFTYTTTIPLKELLEGGEEVVEEKASNKLRNGEIKDILRVVNKTLSARQSVLFFIGKARVRDVQWETNFGMGNAASTAVGAELLHNLKVAMFSLLSHYSNFLTVPQLIVTPIYEMKTIQTYIKCMITFKLGHAMIAVIKLMKSQKNVQGT
ncbi:DUF2953 domain-containing protein [Pseudalkalibacillus hwajinpoensis]|uniref:DUF2953 domain-containing protein n=1 Tax=Guptibacillus hwajinpoensis TaxID=208199 RepID=UPI00325BFCB6